MTVPVAHEGGQLWSSVLLYTGSPLMRRCWWAGLIDLWRGGSEHSQFKMGRLGHTVIWSPVVKPSVASQEFFPKGE